MEQYIEEFQHLYDIKPVKQLVDEVHATERTLYRWGEEGEQHRTNPAEFVVALTRATGDLALVHRMCHELNGTFVPDPLVRDAVSPDLSKARGVLMLHLAEFVAAVARAVLTGSISRSHARAVRQCWNRLKSVGEAFVRACERGVFKPALWSVPDWPPACARPEPAPGHHRALTQRRNAGSVNFPVGGCDCAKAITRNGDG